ncbi:hypothetical protein ACFY0R_42790, partial [Streptomyces sp. NPDC001633]
LSDGPGPQWAVHPLNQQQLATNWGDETDPEIWWHVAVVNDGRHTTMYVQGCPVARNPHAAAVGIASSGKPWLLGGYEYADKKISGFSLTHVSGPGCPVAGDLPVLPVTGALSGDLGSTSVGFSHADEQAAVGSYKVTDAGGVKTELTDTTRAGIGAFTFPAGQQANLLFKLSGGATQVDGTRVQVVNSKEISGAIDSGHFCGASNRYTLHFDIKFDRPFAASGTWVGSTITPDATSLKAGKVAQAPQKSTSKPLKEKHFTVPAKPAPTVHEGTAKASATASAAPSAGTASRLPKAAQAAQPPTTGANGMYLTFDTSANSTVTAKVGISYTSDANAAGNLATEIKNWNV